MTVSVSLESTELTRRTSDGSRLSGMSVCTFDSIVLASEPKPKIDVVPGRRYRFYGREALAYVRSRKDSSDYTRMARQRCFLSAMADQLDPVRALRNFGSLAKTIETNLRTDIPLNRLP